MGRLHMPAADGAEADRGAYGQGKHCPCRKFKGRNFATECKDRDCDVDGISGHRWRSRAGKARKLVAVDAG
jgi:hypothetical protein